MYLCPGCKRVGTLQTRNDRIFCTCGFTLRYLPTGFFSPAQPFETVADWERWQRKALRERDFVPEGEALFSDEELTLTEIAPDHGETLIARGALRQYADRLCCGAENFPLAEIRGMAPVQSDLLLFSFRERYYQIRSEKGANLRKYLEIWKETQ